MKLIIRLILDDETSWQGCFILPKHPYPSLEKHPYPKLRETSRHQTKGRIYRIHTYTTKNVTY